MSTDVKINRYNDFRNLCLKNAENAINSAEMLLKTNSNHIAYHLLVLSLEEVGKIFIGFNEFLKEEKWNKENTNFGIDDHVKKLFWSIWGPTIGKEIINKEQWEENQKMASTLHQKRLNSLYTSINDTIPGSDKISDIEVLELLSFAKTRLNLAKIEGECDPELTENSEIEWLAAANNDIQKRNFIFGQESQKKLFEMGNPRLWIGWLKSYYDKENKILSELIEKEIGRDSVNDMKMNFPKWKMKVKLITPSHSIRQNVLEEFNKVNNKKMKILKGGDAHTLFLEFLFPLSISVKSLWLHGWLTSKFYVGALNIASNGFFYWNAIIDTEKYYETIRDVENNTWLSAKLESALKLNWEERKMSLNVNHLHLTNIIFEYFMQINDKELLNSVNKYLDALALLSKSDIHTRLEHSVFSLFFSSLTEAILAYYKDDKFNNLFEVLYPQLEKMIESKDEFERIIALGYEIRKNKTALQKPITLADVILIKQFSGFFFMTLAVRKLNNDDSINLIIHE